MPEMLMKRSSFHIHAHACPGIPIAESGSNKGLTPIAAGCLRKIAATPAPDRGKSWRYKEVVQ
jgi:hypothetical protein